MGLTQVVILGGGFAGVRAAHELARRAGPRCRILLVSERPTFVFRPALPWLMLGLRRPGDLQVPLAGRLGRVGVEVVHGRVQAVDRRRGCVELERGSRLPYDYLLVALGAEPDLSVPGSADHTFNILWPNPALCARRRLIELCEGQDGRPPRALSLAVVLAPGCPLPCAAYEAVLLLHDFLEQRGCRSRSALHLVTAEPTPFSMAGPHASGVVAGWLDRLGIHLHAQRQPARFERKRILFESGGGLEADFVLLFPPYRGPQALRGLEGLLDAGGFVAVSQSMRSLADERVFAAGDVIGAPGPKTGHLAEGQGAVAARELARALAGAPGGVDGRAAAFDSGLVCLLDGGGADRGLAVLRRPTPGEGEGGTLLALAGPVPKWVKLGLEWFYLRYRV